MNKSELIDAIAEKVGGRKVALSAVEAVIDAIQRAVTTGERVRITGFGVFEKVDRAARVGRNPATGATVKIKKTAIPKFRAGTEFKDYVSGARKLPKVTTARAGAAAKAPAAKAPAAKPAPAGRAGGRSGR